MDLVYFISKIKEYYDDKSDLYRRFVKVLEYVAKIRPQEDFCRFDFDALIVFKPDMYTLMAAFLFYPYEDLEISEEEILELAGEETLSLILAIERIYTLSFENNDETAQLEILKKMFLTMAKDMRVILVVLSQRLFIMENLNRLIKEEYRIPIARETLSLYVPIADRLGVYRMKMRLEDLSFKYLHTDIYNQISKDLAAYGKERERTIFLIKRNLEDLLKEYKMDAEVSGRVKSPYSIHKKFKARNINNFNDFYDIFAMRVIINEESVEKLYEILGMIHSKWDPLLPRFKDYVSNPKPNGYRSLHTIVYGLLPKDSKQPVEIQIRTRFMHVEAEYGMASHWFYKKVGSTDKAEVIKSQSEWLKGLKNIKARPNTDMEDMKKVELDIFNDRIFVLTPGAEVKDLPVGSTPVDFAYSVHTEVGNRCYMAKVNDRVVPLNTELNNGDMVQIVTKVDVQPKVEWLSFVKTSLARNGVKSWFNTLNRDVYIKDGKTLLNKNLAKFGMDHLDQNYTILKNYNDKTLNLSERESLLEEIGKGAQMASDVLRKLFPNLRKKKKTNVFSEKIDHKSIGTAIDKIHVGGELGLPVKIAGCCLPDEGQDIMAYVTRGNSMTIHRKDCSLVYHLDAARFLPAGWSD